MINFDDIKYIAFDADDTLWGNENYFRDAEDQFCHMLENYMPHHAVNKELYLTEVRNIEKYGYGIKAFMLSMIETTLNITNNTLMPAHIKRCIEIGSEMLEKPVVLLEGVDEVLKSLYGKYTLVLATKGDLVDQERKLIKSGLNNYFHHIEIMIEKNEHEYKKFFKRLDCKAEELLMIGNSLKSDVLPVLALGGSAIHIPYHTTWEHERVDIKMDHPKFLELVNIGEILNYIR
jgi:putative hydrolase of the HAD superfamily